MILITITTLFFLLLAIFSLATLPVKDRPKCNTNAIKAKWYVLNHLDEI